MAHLQPFGPYELAERIGVGSLGEVFRAFARQDGRPVALKRLSPSAARDREVTETLQHEARISRFLDHPAIAKVLDVGDVSGSQYIVYEYVHGRDLRAITDRAHKLGEPVPLDVAVHIVLRICEALAHAHARRDVDGTPLGLVHRDVSPPNIMLSVDGGVKLLDFGIARTARRITRRGGQIRGTLGYISPEQVSGGELDGRSDVYSLGACLWELCTGRRLFEGATPIDLVSRMKPGAIPAPSTIAAGISPELDRIVLKALANPVDQRYPTADTFHAELAELARAEGKLIDASRLARYVRNSFPEVAAGGTASREESLNMADNKGGSDLDVFEGLAKKSSRPANPGLSPPSPANPRKATLLGGLGPLPPPSAPPGPGSLPPPVAPPKPAEAASVAPPAPGTLPGMPAPLPPPAQPSRAPSGIGALPVPTPPPSRLPPPVLPPPTITVPQAALPPPAAPPSKLPPPAPPPGRSSAPPAAPLSLGAKLGVADTKPKAAVDMDWDDEEESTHVYDKTVDGSPEPIRPAAGAPAKKVGAAAALLASSGGAAPSVRVAGPFAPPAAQPQSFPPQPASFPPPQSLPPQPQSLPPQAPVQSSAPTRHDEATAIRPRPTVPSIGGSRAGVILGGLALLVVLGLAVFQFLPKKGQFKINITAKGGGSIGQVDIYIDGSKRCDTAPCIVTDLEPGPKTIKVIANGYPPTEPVVETVESNKEKVVFLTLDGAAPSTSQGAGLKIAAADTQKSIKLSVDGVDKGTLPVELKDITPGSHKLKFDGGERYEKLEQSVDIVAGQPKDLGTIKLKVVKGQVTLDLATSGATVTLVRRVADKKVEKKLPDSVWKSPPVKMDVDPSENWKLVATKKGFEEFSQDLNFDDGEAEKNIKIELAETGKPAPTPPADTGAKAPPPDRAPPPDKAPAVAAGPGTLNMNSIPVSKVVLDGKPLGSTPKVGVSVPAGSHTVTFIHPELGKKSVTVQVKPGETKTAAVKFN